MFHPTLPLIISAADDRTVKICELIVSYGEDKTVHVWDLTKRTAIQMFRRENNRFWVLASHPNLNLFAAGHDSGLITFKLEQRPAFAVPQDRDKYVRSYDFNTGADLGLLSVRKFSSAYIPPWMLSFNLAERAVLVTISSDNGLYELTQQAQGEAKESSIDGKKKGTQIIETNKIFSGGTAGLILSSTSSVVLHDIQQQKTLAEIHSPPVKYDGSLSKHTITIANKNFLQHSLIHEIIRIKSSTWDDSGVFIYLTLNHVKYCLSQGDHGVICTLDNPVYLTRVKGKTVHCLDRSARPRTITFNLMEYRFKLALLKNNYEEMLYVICTSTLLGQSITAYLQQKGFPKIALHFVQDTNTRKF
ncbi:coatomer WD associated region-domain-containing protein [Mycena sp. CBHHK59/15]|nr:coatomer WD associated region-domain-containing protein [Mycena sp. CBHHK59/15]